MTEEQAEQIEQPKQAEQKQETPVEQVEISVGFLIERAYRLGYNDAKEGKKFDKIKALETVFKSFMKKSQEESK